MYFTNHPPSATSILFQSRLGTDDLMHSVRRLLQGARIKRGRTHVRIEEDCVHNASWPAGQIVSTCYFVSCWFFLLFFFSFWQVFGARKNLFNMLWIIYEFWPWDPVNAATEGNLDERGRNRLRKNLLKDPRGSASVNVSLAEMWVCLWRVTQRTRHMWWYDAHENEEMLLTCWTSAGARTLWLPRYCVIDRFKSRLLFLWCYFNALILAEQRMEASVDTIFRMSWTHSEDGDSGYSS